MASDVLANELLERVFLLAVSDSGPSVAHDPHFLCTPRIIMDEFRDSSVTESQEQKRISDCIQKQQTLLLSIASVSSLWRRVALAYTILWSNFRVTRTTSCEKAREWLRRSGESKLNLVLDIRRWMPMYQGLFLEPHGAFTRGLPLHLLEIMFMVRHEMPRCKYISVIADCADDIVSVLDDHLCTFPSAPALQRLSICNVGYLGVGEVGDDDEVVDRLDLQNLLSRNAPALTHFRFTGLPLLPSVLSFSVNLTSLSLVRVDGPSLTWSALRIIFGASTALRHVTVWDTRGVPAVSPPGVEEIPCLEMANLTYLAVGKIPIPFAVMLFQQMHIAHLRTLVLEFTSPECDMLGAHLAGLDAGSPYSSLLQTVLDLDVTGFHVSLEIGAAMWRQLDSLESLYICDCRQFFRGLLSIMTVSGWEACGLACVPSAMNISLVNFICPDILDVATFVILRAQLGRRVDLLQLSYFVYDPNGGGETLKRIRKFVGGLQTSNYIERLVDH